MQKDIKDKRYKEKKPFYKKWWVWAIGAVVLVVVLMLFMGAFGTPFSNDGKAGSAVDLSGLTVKEACSKAKKNGWENIYVTVWASGSDYRQSDCDSNLEVQDYDLDDGYCWGVSMSSSTKHNVCIKAYENGYTGPDKNKTGSSSQSSESSDSQSTTGATSSGSSSANSQPSSGSSSSSSTSSSSTNSSFRKVMDDYESFMNRYVDFMKKYKNSSDISSMLTDYASMMQDYAKYADSITGYNQNNLSASDWAYYLEVTARVNKKLAEI